MATVPSMMVTTLTPNGESSSRRVSEMALTAALEEAYVPAMTCYSLILEKIDTVYGYNKKPAYRSREY